MITREKLYEYAMALYDFFKRSREDICFSCLGYDKI